MFGAYTPEFGSETAIFERIYTELPDVGHSSDPIMVLLTNARLTPLVCCGSILWAWFDWSLCVNRFCTCFIIRFPHHSIGFLKIDFSKLEILFIQRVKFPVSHNFPRYCSFALASNHWLSAFRNFDIVHIPRFPHLLSIFLSCFPLIISSVIIVPV